MGYRNVNHRLVKIVQNFHQLILQHLTDEELMVFSEVDEQFDSAIQRCRLCMSKLTFHLTIDKSDRFEQLEKIHKSKRRYPNFKLTCGNKEDVSLLFFNVLDLFYNSIVRIECIGVALPTNQMNFNFPNCRFLKISYSNLNTLHVLLNSTEQYQNLHIEGCIEPLNQRHIFEQIMRFRNVRLSNMEEMDMKIIKNLDFLFSNCIKFSFEGNRQTTYDKLANLFEVLKCSELKIQKSSPGYEGYRLAIHRLKRTEDINVPIVEIFSRRKRQKIENHSPGDVTYLPMENCSVLLEISSLSWTFMKKIGRAMKELKVLNIFEISNHEKRGFFQNFHGLEKIITSSDKKSNKMETETVTLRESMEMKRNKDPLCYIPFETLEHIFQHLNIDDFQNASNVSTSWNNAISKSHRYMKMLRLTCRPLRKSDADIIMRSHKHFQDFDISGHNNKKLVPDIVKVINYFSNYLTTVSLYQVKTHRIQSFYIPNLKVLKLHTVSDNIPGSFFDCCQRITSIKFQNMRIKEKYFNRLNSQRGLEKLAFVDCYLLDMKYSKFKETLNMNLKYLEYSFYMSQLCGDSDNAGHVEKLIEQHPAYANVENLVLNGFRGTIVKRILKLMKNLKKLELQNMGMQDFSDLEEYPDLEVELYFQNREYESQLNWKDTFPKAKTVYVCTNIEPREINQLDETERNFLALMSLSGKQMMKNQIAYFTRKDNITIDPLQVVPTDLYDLIFQHLSFMDARNAIEVSPTWNFVCKNSKVLLDKMTLKLPSTDYTRDRSNIKAICGNHQNIILYACRFDYIKNFTQNVRNLTVYCNDHAIASKTKFNWPNLETLTLTRKNPKDNQVSCKNTLENFAFTSKLKSLIILEKIDDDSSKVFIKILSRNRNLKILKAPAIGAMFDLFYLDWSDISFHLEKLHMGLVYDEILQKNNAYVKLLKFLQLHRSTCEELIISHCSMEMFAEIFGNYSKLHTFYAFRTRSKERVPMAINCLIKTCLLPEDLEISEGPYFIERLPNVEKLFIPKLDDAVVTALSTLMLSLQNVSYLDERDSCIKGYENRAGRNPEQMNSKIEFLKLKSFRFLDINEFNVFDPKSPFKWVMVPRTRIDRRFEYHTGPGGRRYRSSDDDDDDDDDDDMEEEHYRN